MDDDWGYPYFRKPPKSWFINISKRQAPNGRPAEAQGLGQRDAAAEPEPVAAHGHAEQVHGAVPGVTAASVTVDGRWGYTGGEILWASP